MPRTTISHDYPPMEAKVSAKLPEGKQWQYEPKWDGFRCIAFREGEEVELRSKSGQPLGRYFPEVVEALKKLEPETFVLDGELVIQIGDSFSFDALLQRIHPAESRVKHLSESTPATYIVFDLLVSGTGDVLVDKILAERRIALEEFAAQYLKLPNVILSIATDDPEGAKSWLTMPGVFIDGIIAKRTDMSYQSGNRTGMMKVKRNRTADCVIGGFRYASGSDEVGSLLLGLYDEDGELHHVGYSSGFKSIYDNKLTQQLESMKTDKSFTVNVPGGPSRWSTKRSTEWVPVEPNLVVEVKFDHVSDGRFRHGTKVLRWRPEKAPKQCTIEQMQS